MDDKSWYIYLMQDLTMAKGLLVYRAFSFYEFFRVLIGKIAAGVGMISALLHFDENPVVIILFVSFCLALILFIGDEQILIYESVVVQRTNSLANYLFDFRGEAIHLVEIEESFLDTSVPDAYASLVIELLSFVSKKNFNDGSQPIFLKMKDGSLKQLLTNLDFSKRERIVEEINKLLRDSPAIRPEKPKVRQRKMS